MPAPMINTEGTGLSESSKCEEWVVMLSGQYEYGVRGGGGGERENEERKRMMRLESFFQFLSFPPSISDMAERGQTRSKHCPMSHNPIDPFCALMHFPAGGVCSA